MPKVKFLKNDKGAEDGINVIEFKEGQEYEISDSLARQFVIRRTAEILPDPVVVAEVFDDEPEIVVPAPQEAVQPEEPVAPEQTEEKALEGPAENKKKLFSKKGQ